MGKLSRSNQDQRYIDSGLLPASLFGKSSLKKHKRAIRPFTVSRKNSLHYSSEEGVEMAMTYLTIIETAKMWGLQVKEYLTYVWREAIYGNNDLEALLLPAIATK